MNDVGLWITRPEEAEARARRESEWRTYFVPAFTGLGAPYWDSGATGLLTGITRTTGKNEIVKACLESIAYQITDLVCLMRRESGYDIRKMKADGGPTVNAPCSSRAIWPAPMGECLGLQELSGMGAYLAGISSGLYDEKQI